MGIAIGIEIATVTGGKTETRGDIAAALGLGLDPGPGLPTENVNAEIGSETGKSGIKRIGEKGTGIEKEKEKGTPSGEGEAL